MEVLRWNDRFSVSNEEIDYQHKMLFNLVNYLTTSSGKSYNRTEIGEILDELIAYTEYHFAFEEELLKNHLSIDSHREIHQGFIAKVHYFEEEFKKGEDVINSELFTFLVSWIKDHILGTDVVFFKSLDKN